MFLCLWIPTYIEGPKTSSVRVHCILLGRNVRIVQIGDTDCGWGERPAAGSCNGRRSVVYTTYPKERGLTGVVGIGSRVNSNFR